MITISNFLSALIIMWSNITCMTQKYVGCNTSNKICAKHTGIFLYIHIIASNTVSLPKSLDLIRSVFEFTVNFQDIWCICIPRVNITIEILF